MAMCAEQDSLEEPRWMGGKTNGVLSTPGQLMGINRENETTMAESLVRSIASQSGLVKLQVSYLVLRYTQFYLLSDAA